MADPAPLDLDALEADARYATRRRRPADMDPAGELAATERVIDAALDLIAAARRERILERALLQAASDRACTTFCGKDTTLGEETDRLFAEYVEGARAALASARGEKVPD